MQSELKAGKGHRIPLNDQVARFVADATATILEAWSKANTEKEFFEFLPWKNDVTDAQYGRRKWVALTMGTEELRVAATRNKNGQLGIDIRNWWT